MTLAQLAAEGFRMELMCSLEDRLAAAGIERIAGVDEAGRGCLAGPVVAAAVVMDSGATIPGVDDSKRVDADRRRALARTIRARARAVAVAAVPAAVIDRINILRATRRGMCQALLSLAPAPDAALVDAVPLPGLPFPTWPVVRGDAFSYAVACASIVAKAERDRLMGELDAEYPQYGFATHKGYAAPEHLESLAVFGPCPAHRLTFRSVLPAVES